MGIIGQSTTPLRKTDGVGRFYPHQSKRYHRIVAVVAGIVLSSGYDSVTNWPKMLVELGLRQMRPQDLHIFWLDVILKLHDFYKYCPLDGAIRQIKFNMPAIPSSVFPPRHEILAEAIESEEERLRMYVLLTQTLEHADTLATARMVDRPSWFNAVRDLADSLFSSCYAISGGGENVKP